MAFMSPAKDRQRWEMSFLFTTLEIDFQGCTDKAVAGSINSQFIKATGHKAPSQQLVPLCC